MVWRSYRSRTASIFFARGEFRLVSFLIATVLIASLISSLDDMWNDTSLTMDHPNLVGLYGWLPATDKLNLSIASATAAKVRATWNLTNSYGWDFPMLALSAARLQENRSQGIADLFSPFWSFDDAGYPVGNVVVPTPYFPASGSLLYVIAYMAAGWDGDDGLGAAPGFPAYEEGWGVKWEGLQKGI